MKIILKIKVDGMMQNSTNLPEFIPENAEFYWEDIEILPIKELKNGVCEEVKEGEEDFWSVYLHQLNGGLECVADLRTKEEAQKLTKLIENAANYRVYSKTV
jgi:hypothetical protein